MKIFGIELALDSTDAKVRTASEFADALDVVHDSLTGNSNVYSADIVQDGADRASLLVGIKVADEVSSDELPGMFQSAVEGALESAGLDGVAIEVAAPARQMAYAN